MFVFEKLGTNSRSLRNFRSIVFCNSEVLAAGSMVWLLSRALNASTFQVNHGPQVSSAWWPGYGPTPIGLGCKCDSNAISANTPISSRPLTPEEALGLQRDRKLGYSVPPQKRLISWFKHSMAVISPRLGLHGCRIS